MASWLDDDMLWWANFPANQHENVDHDVVEKIRDAPKKWLYSLPMYEYAYILCTVAAHKGGGEIGPYMEDLYKTRMNPILKAYYDKLFEYRFKRMIAAYNFDSMRKTLNPGMLTELLAEIRLYAMKTRKALRGVVMDFLEERGVPTTQKTVEETLPENYG